MRRKLTRRTKLALETLEGRSLQSGLATSALVDKSSLLLPYIEQENVNQATNPAREVGTGGQTQIIAILIG